MSNRYKLDRVEANQRHVKFNVFDPRGANCGTLTILASDAANFVQNSWRGDVFWNGLVPESPDNLRDGKS